MVTTLATRKSIVELSLEDLEAFPIWEFADDEETTEGRDETWVRPLNAFVLPDRTFSVTVAANIKFSSGRAFPGFVGGSVLGAFEANAVGVISQGQYVVFQANPILQTLRANALAKLGLTENDVFPLQYELRVPVEGHSSPVCGTIV